MPNCYKNKNFTNIVESDSIFQMLRWHALDLPRIYYTCSRRNQNRTLSNTISGISIIQVCNISINNSKHVYIYHTLITWSYQALHFEYKHVKCKKLTPIRPTSIQSIQTFHYAYHNNILNISISKHVLISPIFDLPFLI